MPSESHVALTAVMARSTARVGSSAAAAAATTSAADPTDV